MSEFASWQVARRAAIARVFLALAFVVLAGAFFRVQVLQSERHQLESRSNRLRAIPLPAPRGEILDRNGLLIAENVPGFTVRVMASNSDSLMTVLARMNDLLATDSFDIDIDAVVQRWKAATYQPAMVFASGTFSQVATLDEHRAVLPGLVIQSEPRRHYPLGEAVGHLVGYVGEVSAGELADQAKFPATRMGDVVGKLGVELEYDSLLRGRNGIRYVEVTARHRTVRDQGVPGSVVPAVGQTITTTIDLELQRFVDSMWRKDMPDKRGALLAMKPNGEILAYYSYPSFDPNSWVGGISRSAYRELSENPGRPLINRVISGRYPPASPFKLATAAMGLKRGLITASTRMPVPCTGRGFRFGNRVFQCHNRTTGHGSLDLIGAVATSCDVYFYQLGLMLGEEALFEEGAAFGVGDLTGVDLSGEQKSIFPSSIKSYVNSRGANWWSRGEILNLSIGQGYNAQTLINMTSFYAAIGGDGIKRAPYLVRPAPPGSDHDLGLSPDNLRDLRAAMAAVTERGTGRSGYNPLTRMAGKTGTGQVTGQQDIAWFIGYAPAEAPEIVVGILVEEGLHGSSFARHVQATVSRWLLGPGSRPDLGGVDFPITVDLRDDERNLPADSVAAPPDSTTEN